MSAYREPFHAPPDVAALSAERTSELIRLGALAERQRISDGLLRVRAEALMAQNGPKLWLIDKILLFVADETKSEVGP